MEKPYTDLPVHKVRLSECDDIPMVLHCNLWFPLLSVQQNKPELDQKESWMEQDDTLCKGTLTHTEHDNVSNDEVNSTQLDGNAADDMSSVPTGPVIHSKSKGQNLTVECFVIMSQGVNWLTDSWKNDCSWSGRS